MTWVMASATYTRKATRVNDPASAPPLGADGASLPAAEGLLSVRVSELLQRYPAMLQVLIDHGFAPLAQPALRAVLAPTVTLAQALKIRSLDGDRERDLLRNLAAVADAARTGA